MSITALPRSTAESTAAPRQSRLRVPWATVVPLAVVLTYADGFWMTSLRGAVGAIERTQSPFSSWWRESTLVLPVFVLAVLAAMTLAMRWFGPELRKPQTILATALLIAVAGSVAGIAVIAASSAYDYHLQSAQLRTMGSMATTCTGTCLAQLRHDTLAVHLRGILYVSRWLVLTNVVLVAWTVAMRGGRIRLSATGRGAARQRETGNRSRDVRLILVAGLLAAAAVHAAVIPEHLAEWTAAGAFFIALTTAEITVAGLLLTGLRQRAVLFAAATVSVGPLVLWLYSRTAGLPFGPDAWLPEAIGLPDCVACLLEAGTLIAAVVLIRESSRLGRHPAASAHAIGLALVATIAVTAIGLGGTDVSWLTVLGPGEQSSMNMSH